MLPAATRAFSLLSAAMAVGAAPPSPQPAVRAMGLDEALAYARAHQPAIRSVLARVAAAAADTRVARAQWMPALGATAQAFEGTTNNSTASYIGAPRVDLPRIGGTRVGGLDDWAPSTSTLVAVGANQEVFDFGRIAAQAAVADAAYEGERLRADDERLRVDLVVREAFLAVAGARAIARAATGAVQRARLHRDMAAAGVKSGLHAPIELTRAAADLARFEVDEVRAGGALRASQAAFAAAVGTSDPLLDAAGEPSAMRPAPPLTEALRGSADHAPILQGARAAVRAAETVERAIGAELRPELVLTGTLSARAGTASPSSGSTSDGHGPLPTVPNWDIGLVLRWPVFDGVVAARRASAASRVEVRRADLAALSQQQVASLQRAYVALEVGQAALGSLTEALRAAEANHAQAEARFKAGLGTALELGDAETLRTDAEIRLALGQFEAARARAVIARLMGEDL
jgi:outer membrane protein